MKLNVSREILPLSIVNFVEFEKKRKMKKKNKKVVFVNVNLERKMPNVQCWLANHATNLKHNFDFSNPKILDKENNLEKRFLV